ncbi:MAG TPA: bifunctional 2-polyprenyl-6-hydroxyphenol methylase/3-demethylubiquinol 3-O-methyltransferase UbiG [Sphingopyxis sp.]|nr:bifunctional 2-polyprenyl-6-hydroxyphenol methylase/3-demethylubiquinol 3-O-methyltransferase UbiG [Sphingopyxis sp.]
MTSTTINPQEAAHFGALAAEWWDPKGSSAMLHKLNPVRLSYIRSQIDTYWQLDARDRFPLRGKAVLDAGCGAGLLVEPLARLGAAVTGVDAAPENIEAARAHAAGQDLDIRYHAGELASLPPQTFDLITSMEVIEHVTDPAVFVQELASRLAPDGLMILSTPNRTALSKILLVEAAERIGAVPRGTHDWDQFITPNELADLLADAGLEVMDRTGLAPSLAKGFTLGGSDSLNYLVTARRR